MIQKASFIDRLVPRPPPIQKEYDEDVLNLAACEVITVRHRLSKLQKLWLLNLKNRDGILNLTEEYGEVIIQLRIDDERNLVTSERIVYELEQELLHSNYERKNAILKAYMNGTSLDVCVMDEVYDPKAKVSHHALYTPAGKRFNIMFVKGSVLNSDAVLPNDIF